jgi:hypothetical protein
LYCRKCGTQNDDNAFRCVSCGEVIQAVEPARIPIGTVPDYLVWSILAAVFCCQISGIVAIVYAAQVNGRLMAGDLAGATDASNKARTWCWVSLGAWCVMVVGYIVAFAAMALVGAFAR